MRTEDKSFTFRLPIALLESLQVIAVAQDLSLAQLMRRVLREYVVSTGKEVK